jgi:NAD(P)-dependent dehydrogenase (short-subunit alcohol dehydrogenase family)
VITGGDSGIGRAVACFFAMEGAHICIVYKNSEQADADEVRKFVEGVGGKFLGIAVSDLGKEEVCKEVVERVRSQFERCDILVNNAAEQHVVESIQELSQEQVERTFQTNVFAMFMLTRLMLPLIPKGGRIINTTSVLAYKGSASLLDYSATKGAILAFTRALAQQLSPDIRVNGVSPGPIWTPLIVTSYKNERATKWDEKHSESTLMKRVGQPADCAGAYVYLASDESAYITGQVLHPNGGMIVNA